MEKEDYKPRVVETFDANFNFSIPGFHTLNEIFLHEKNQAKCSRKINLAEKFTFWK